MVTRSGAGFFSCAEPGHVSDTLSIVYSDVNRLKSTGPQPRNIYYTALWPSIAKRKQGQLVRTCMPL